MNRPNPATRVTELIEVFGSLLTETASGTRQKDISLEWASGAKRPTWVTRQRLFALHDILVRLRRAGWSDKEIVRYVGADNPHLGAMPIVFIRDSTVGFGRERINEVLTLMIPSSAAA